MMFAKLRRRRTATATRAAHQHVAEPSARSVDAGTLGRIERVRAALTRVIEVQQSAEPAWFVRVRAGETVPATAKQWQQVSDYLQGIPVEFVLSDAAVTDLLDRIEVAEELIELGKRGVRVRSYRGSITSAATARNLLALAQQVEIDEATGHTAQAPKSEPHEDWPEADRP
ncbi:hypothetical protein ACWDBW_30215 [Streptomyces sp. NPDC001107]